jgi:hypothetical protein
MELTIHLYFFNWENCIFYTVNRKQNYIDSNFIHIYIVHKIIHIRLLKVLQVKSASIMEDSNTTFENNEITTGSANYEFKYGTDNPFYNYEYSEEVGMYYLYLRNKNMFKVFFSWFYYFVHCIYFQYFYIYYTVFKKDNVTVYGFNAKVSYFWRSYVPLSVRCRAIVSS